MVSVLVTGGAGFIGSHITDELVKKGHEVRVIDDLSNGNENNISHIMDRIDFINGSITDPVTVKKAVEGVDYVLHQAALGSVPRSLKDPLGTNEVNVTGTLNVILASKDAGVKRLVHASSSSVYGDIKENPKREDMGTAPISPYGLTKVLAENYLESFHEIFGMKSIALRYSNVYGPRQNPNLEYAAVIPKFIKAALRGEKAVIYGDGEQTRDLTYIRDVVSANILAMENKSVGYGVFNISNGSTITINELHKMIGQACGADIEPEHTGPREGDIKHSTLDITRAREKLGYEPGYNLESGLRETVKWYRESLDG